MSKTIWDLTPEEREAAIKQLRELGVIEAHGITIGPDPKLVVRSEPETEEQRAQRAAIAHRNTMFAACSVKPKLKFLKGGK